MLSDGDDNFMEHTFTDVENKFYIDRFYTFFEEIHEPSYEYPGELHDFWECFYIVRGSACVTSGKKTYDIKAGELIIHQPLDFHKYRISSDQNTHIIVFTFSLSGSMKSALRHKIIRPSDDEKTILNMLMDYVRKNKTDDKFSYTAYIDKPDASDEYLQKVSAFVTLLLLSFIENKNIGVAMNDPDSLYYEKAIEYMLEHIYQKVTIPEIADYCGISPTSLKTIVRKYSGFSLHKYFLHMKLKKSIKLLKNGVSISEVAEQLGFCSQPYFSSAFRREFGFSPSEIKKGEISEDEIFISG